jgi:hypothetical protein
MKVFLSLLALAAVSFGSARAQGGGSQTGSAPNYKPAPGSNSPAKGQGKTPGRATTGKVVVSPGGQGHNSGSDPKGKILVAPSVTTTGKGAAKPASKQ